MHTSHAIDRRSQPVIAGGAPLIQDHIFSKWMAAGEAGVAAEEEAEASEAAEDDVAVQKQRSRHPPSARVAVPERA